MRLIAAIWLRNKPQYVGRVDGARMADRGMGGWGSEEGVGGVHPNTPHKAGLLRRVGEPGGVEGSGGQRYPRKG